MLVTNFADIERVMEQGTINRTVAATNMNETSSRAHTIVTITLTQKNHKPSGGGGGTTTTTSIVNIVDLAGRYTLKNIDK